MAEIADFARRDLPHSAIGAVEHQRAVLCPVEIGAVCVIGICVHIQFRLFKKLPLSWSRSLNDVVQRGDLI